MDLSDNTPDVRFTSELLACQDDLYAYLFSLTLDIDAAEELLQQTNLVLCKKAREAAAAPSFRAWAFKAAQLETMAYRRRDRRQRSLPLDDEAIGVLAEEGIQDESKTLHSAALAACLQELPKQQRTLILRRYQPGVMVKRLADDMHRSVDTVSNMLYRIRQALLACVQRKLGEESRP